MGSGRRIGRGSARTARCAEYEEAAETDASVALLARREKPNEDAGERVYVLEGGDERMSSWETSRVRSNALLNGLSVSGLSRLATCNLTLRLMSSLHQTQFSASAGA